jgi:acyl-CoA thioesterase-1
MRNLLLYHLVSGHAWFTCGGVFLLVIILDVFMVFDGRQRLRRAGPLLLLLLVVLAGLSGTPLSLWLAGPLLASCLAYAFYGFANRRLALRFSIGACAAVFVLAGLILELPYHFPGSLHGPRLERLYVIGDSLAAGTGDESMTWPRLLGKETGLEVRDLSEQGATTRWALKRQASRLGPEARPEEVVLIEIGGHDMLGTAGADAFGEAFDQLLSAAQGDGAHPRGLVVLELPIIPGKWAYGAQQRRVAARHGALLVPKRLLAGVVLTQENTTDGLHLSTTGHERMAQLLIPWLGVASAQLESGKATERLICPSPWSDYARAGR